jgi:phage shock protein PspC (stress-responsive transcriptional regulator)
MEKRLTRNSTDSVFGGVCSGMAAYLGMDITLMRILCVIMTVFTGGFLMGAVYLVLWAVLPAAEGPPRGAVGSGRGILWLAAALIALGVFLLLRELLPVNITPYLFAVGLIAAGTLLIWTTVRNRQG